jgi:hypothetical protein
MTKQIRPICSFKELCEMFDVDYSKKTTVGNIVRSVFKYTQCGACFSVLTKDVLKEFPQLKDCNVTIKLGPGEPKLELADENLPKCVTDFLSVSKVGEVIDAKVGALSATISEMSEGGIYEKLSHSQGFKLWIESVSLRRVTLRFEIIPVYKPHEMSQYWVSGETCNYKGAIYGIQLAGYVEGTEAACPNHIFTYMDNKGKTSLKEWVKNTLVTIEDDAQELWHETHGCSVCEARGAGSKIKTEKSAIAKGFSQGGPTHPNCPYCKGQGIII